ncbi:complex I intermediate-associated protein-like protein 84 [Lophiotrema nucula]|uniref:Complex I intermediate-associated protein-like protein 84 n=1 Tax=Lophiotrema nucula TaxID=690887 RepID=A0A6A5YNM7_9PLEO|nr:complex I intermediate-associated protein-like protein 84 [Lophiotrema nucula]
MPSHLTRVVFRNLIANKPVLYRGCLYRPTRARLPLQHGFRAVMQPQRRTFWNIWKPQRSVKDAQLMPGFDKMLEVVAMEDQAYRPPPPPDVAKAFKLFFAQRDRTFEDFHIKLADRCYKYLQDNPQDDGRPWLAVDDLRMVLMRLGKPPKDGGKPHLELARLLYAELRKQTIGDDEEGVNSTDLEAPDADHVRDIGHHIGILCLYGASSEARDLAQKTMVGGTSLRSKLFVTSVWHKVLLGFSSEGNEQELLRTMDVTRKLSVPFTTTMQAVLVHFFTRKNDLEHAKFWFSQPAVTRKNGIETQPEPASLAAILRLCALKGDLSFGQQVVSTLLKGTPDKVAWDAVFLWSAAIGKGVDEVDRMMNVMTRRNDEARSKDPEVRLLRPDIDTINELVEFSMSKQDPYSAERYIALGDKRGIMPNAKTNILQMQYRLAANDVDGARTAYYGLHSDDVKNDSSIPVVNQLVRAMCDAKQHHFDDIMAIVDELHERKARFEPDTVATLCLLHLRRGELYDAADVLQIHAHNYSPKQRATIRDRLLGFLLDRQISTAEAWDSYTILRNVFPETPRNIRLKIMKEFFARKRSDMACHVFFHMRESDHSEIAADRDVYVAAFTGFARNADAESLELVSNQLKLDVNVELDTKMRNSLMLAYAATENNKKALKYWAEIAASKEGPTYNSIAIAFRSCEGLSWGDHYAKPIWQRLKEMDIDIDKVIFTAYIGALARSRLHDEVVEMLATVEQDYGFTPDLYMLGNWYNATASIDRQPLVEAWIKEHYPAVWTELDGLGYTKTMDGFGYKLYNINRDLDP